MNDKTDAAMRDGMRELARQGDPIVSAHTPGPWAACQPDSNFTRGCRVIKDVEHKNVADIMSHRGAGYANARLIASAPDLLAALQALDDADQLGCANWHMELPAGQCECTGCKARSAIAKAVQP